MIWYIPRVHCTKCDKEVTPRRVHDAKIKRRYLVVECHGEKQEVEFADRPPDSDVKRVFGQEPV